MVSMKLERAKDIKLEYGEYLEFINASNRDNDDWVPFDSIESLKTFLFSNPNYDAERHFLILVEERIVADLFIKLHASKPGVAEMELNICVERRNKGLGERLLATALNLLNKSVGITQIILSPGNHEILSFAKAEGFSVLTQVDLIHDLKLPNLVHAPLAYQIQPANVGQLEDVTLLRNQIFSTTHSVEELETIMQGKSILTNIMVTTTNKKVIGYCIAQKDSRTLSEEGWIVEIAVKQEHRRKGIGKAILLTSLNWLKSIGCNQVTVNCMSDNISALKLYEETGFKVFRVKEKILERKK